MSRIIHWVRSLLFALCKHPPEQVTADLLEGELRAGEHPAELQWCHCCGSTRWHYPNQKHPHGFWQKSWWLT